MEDAPAGPQGQVFRGAVAGAIAGPIAGAAAYLSFMGPMFLMRQREGLGDLPIDNLTWLPLVIGAGLGLPVGALVGALFAWYRRNATPAYSTTMTAGALATVGTIAAFGLFAGGLGGLWGYSVIGLRIGLLPGAIGGGLWRFLYGNRFAARPAALAVWPIVIAATWVAAWLHYEYFPNLDGPHYVEVSGEVRESVHAGDSGGGPPPGFYVRAGDLGGRIYLPKEAAPFVGHEITARGLVDEECYAGSNCYPSITIDNAGGSLKVYTGPPPTERALRATAQAETATAEAGRPTATPTKRPRSRVTKTPEGYPP